MKLHQLIDQSATGYTTWGCMWKQGECQPDTQYVCRNEEGKEVPIQSRITAYWPDGSVKWTAHTGDSRLLKKGMEVLPGVPAPIEGGLTVEEKDDGEGYIVRSDKLCVTVPKSGGYLIQDVIYNGKRCAENFKAVLILEEPGVMDGNPVKIEKNYTGRIEDVGIEEAGPLECIFRCTGSHVNEKGESRLPFIIRMKIHHDCRDIRFTHTFLYDGDENKDYLKGLGIRFEMPLAGEIYNRHIEFMGDYGMFHEAMVPLMSWRPRVPAGIYERQMAGECLALEGQDLEIVNKVLQDTPYWSEYDFCQDSVSHFSVRKKLRLENACYIDCLHGQRSKGGLAVGSEGGSVMVCIRDFWEKYPSGYTVRGMDTDKAECTMWLWSPGAPAMDFRHYAERGYNQVCYEGYDYKGATPDGIACTNECMLRFTGEMIPEESVLEEFAVNVNYPPFYVGDPEFYHEMKAFGYWSLPSRTTEMENWLENQLDTAFAFYEKEVEQRGWYGMFNYGDFMHTYDSVRHQWKYDIGGYAWDNTELVPTLWLWYYFLRTGRADVFTLAEKMSRHASEVDVYHTGKYKGLGSRHNVRHWGCPCKEARIAMASHHRVYYYLTGDRRLEDIFEELKDNEMSFLNKDPLGDFYNKEEMVFPSHARSGPDWSSLCSNWMMRWERFNDTKYRDKILVGMGDIKAAPLKLVSGPDFEFDPATCHLRYIGERTTGGTHLQICMGAPSVWMEMADLLDDEEWKEMIAQYGRFYYLPKEEQQKESNGLVGEREFSLPFMAAAMGAYGAWYLKDDVLAERTWKILLHSMISENSKVGFEVTGLPDKGNQKLLQEIPWITTNFVAQFCLNTIMSLEFIRGKLPATVDEAQELVRGMDVTLFRKA